MKLVDIMRKPSRNLYEVLLSGNQSLTKTNSIQIAQSEEEVLGIVNEEKEIIGEVKRELIVFLVEKCNEYMKSVVLENIEEGIVAIDKSGRIFYVNSMYAVILGVPVHKVIGKFMHEIEEGASILDVLKTGEPIHQKNLRIKSIGKYVDVKIYPIMEDEQIEGAYSIFKDITELKELGREVRRVRNVASDYLRQNEALKELKNHNIIGESGPFLDVISKTLIVAPTDISVMVRGENGVGKEIFAQLIHKNSLRKKMPIVSLNCAAIPENLIESELFGYEEGAFTGAVRQGKVGKFQLADKGTLFLDEIGDLPMHLQSKLLRVLQEGEIQPLGSKKSLKIDVRIITATNQPLETLIKEKKFRKDLYYRLNGISLFIPQLKERGTDVILLAQYFLEKFNKEFQKEAKISREVYNAFMNYDWPGNVRELINCMKSSVLLCADNLITLEDLPSGMTEMEPEMRSMVSEEVHPLLEEEGALKDRIKKFEQSIILHTLEKHKGDYNTAMLELGLAKRTFYRRLEEIKEEVGKE